MTDISIVVPVYNEAEHVLPFYYELRRHLKKDFELVWIDDGSTDSTLAEIEQLSAIDARIRCICLTRNFGQVAAISAGLDYTLAPTVIIMSGNLKNPPSIIPEMLAKIDEGFEIVNAESTNHLRTFFIQKKLLDWYYSLLNRLAPRRNDDDITSFRAFNYKVSEGIRQVKERNLLLNDFFNWSGYKKTSVLYDCSKCGYKNKKYSLSHLKLETLKVFKNTNTGILKSVAISGLIVTGASAISLSKMINHLLSGKSIDNKPLILCGISFAFAVFLLIKSRYRLQREKYFNEKVIPKYLVKEIIEQDNTYYKMDFELLKKV